MSSGPKGAHACREVRLIAVTTCIGAGVEADPCRHVYELFTTSGQLVARYDVCDEANTMATAALSFIASGVAQ